ncbi:MAG: tetratricopeptide repeat protein [Deltaproteobacteria bacterium]|nr:tetratricopeptide repeat protein [Deltaproteobacteria bacterium]
MNILLVLVILAVLAFLFSKSISRFFYNRMEKKDPSPFSSSNFQIAQKFELRKEYDKAILAYTHLIDEFPDFEAAYLSIAEIYKKKKEYDKAISWLERLYEKNKNSDVIYMICEMYMAEGNDVKTEEFFNKHCKELDEFRPIIDAYLKVKRHNDKEAYTHLKILACSEGVKDYIRFKAKRALSYL